MTSVFSLLQAVLHCSCKNTCLIELVPGSHEPQASCFLHESSTRREPPSFIPRPSKWSESVQAQPPLLGGLLQTIVLSQAGETFCWSSPTLVPPPPTLSSLFLPPWEPQLLFYSMKCEPLNTETVLPHF